VKRRWVPWATGIFVLVCVVALVAFILVGTDVVERWARGALIGRIQQSTGTRVEIGAFRLHLWNLHVEIDNLTLHGLEATGQPPLFHADRIEVGARILSFLGRKIALEDLIVARPQVAIEVDRDGHSNVPSPHRPPSKTPWRTTLFSLHVARLELQDGSAVYNNQRVPLSVSGQDFNFVLHYNAPANGSDSYVGNFGWQRIELAAKRDLPFPFGINVNFTLHRDSFSLDELALTAFRSSLNVQASLPSFAQSNWDLKYRGRISLADMRKIMRKPTMPDGDADFTGQAHYRAASSSNDEGQSGDWTGSGYYTSRNIALPYRFYHEKGIETSGDFQVANRRLVVSDLSARAMGGTVDGQLEMDFKGLAFHTKTRLRGASLARLFNALDNDELPVNSLHWDAVADLESVNTWNANFKNFRSTGEMRWTPPGATGRGVIPASARIDYDYRSDRQVVSVSQSEISTPSAHVAINGTLGATDSALEATFNAANLFEWNDFIAAIRGPEAGPHRVAGQVTWRGRVIGPLTEASFVGHVSATNPQYDNLAWDHLEGDMEYSPDGFLLKNAIVRHGPALFTMNLSLQFAGNWNFLPSSMWMLDARVERVSGDDLQALLDTRYPVTVELSGDVHGHGTRAAPIFDSNFVAQNIAVASLRADRMTGAFHWGPDLIKLSNAQLRENFGTVAGTVSYQPHEQHVEFDLAGHAIALDRIKPLQTASLPIGGSVDFDLRGNGPLLAPVAQGDLKITALTLGTESEGDFAGRVESDGKTARFALASSPARERFQGDVTVALGGDENISGRLSVQQFDLDPLIVAGLHLSQLTGHGSADALFTISGSLRRPDTIEVDANIARISFNYEFVQLTNDQNIRLAYRRNEVRIEQARLHGPDTDVQMSGSARFDRDKRLDFVLSGGMNLRLIGGFVPDLHANGRADVNVSVQGTLAQPRVTGNATVSGASATYGEFPLGLSHVNGGLVFDKSRLLFDKVTAEAGGGQLTLSGSVSYGETPVRYQVAATTSTVRIRYPTGVSWLAGGRLDLSGTSDAAIVSGRVEVQRVLFSQGVDVASFFASGVDVTPSAPSTSTFLQNLAFDVEGETTPGARIEWSGAHVEMDGDVRLRGTWDRPVLLGDIHLLGGEMPFRGNTFELTRGDINFANPFRLDPVLNVEATANINQYQVTIDFSGPSSHLSLNYRSDPPLPDTDIVALLALGSPGEEAGLRSQPGSSENYGATALLSEAISTGVGGRIEHLFGISSFRVDPFVAGTATESNAAARVTIQEQVTPDLSITYSTNASSNQYQAIQADYALKPGIAVEFLRDINGTYGMDIKFVKHFK
jgi:translocation and assembly module TamB